MRSDIFSVGIPERRIKTRPSTLAALPPSAVADGFLKVRRQHYARVGV
jgi:hypothetical protein